LSADEKPQVVTKSDHLIRLKFSRTMPFALTGHGAIQAANVLNSELAIEMRVHVVRALVRLRASLLSHQEFSQRLKNLENRTELLTLKTGTAERETRAQLKQLFSPINQLMAPPQPLAKRPIGFVTQEDTTAPQKTTTIKKWLCRLPSSVNQKRGAHGAPWLVC